jgi:hypothetical protein
MFQYMVQVCSLLKRHLCYPLDSVLGRTWFSPRALASTCVHVAGQCMSAFLLWLIMMLREGVGH